MNLKTDELVTRGRRHHLYTINKIMDAGSIRNIVKPGMVTSGIMYGCIKNNVLYVLAGSIRDDRPLPDVIQNTIEAQDARCKYLMDENLGMVLMVATPSLSGYRKSSAVTGENNLYEYNRLLFQ